MAIYIKYSSPTIDGDTTTKGFEKNFEVDSFQFGIGRGIGSPTGKGANREATTPSISEIVVTKVLDSASPGLVKEALSGQGKATVVISHVRTDGSAGAVGYLQWTLSNVMLSGWSISAGGDKPTESLSLNFTKVEFKYTPQKDDGTAGSSVVVTQDLTTGVTS